MTLSRRAFIGGVPLSLATPGLLAAGTERPRSGRQEDPLGVRDDFPVTTRGTYLNSAYITPSPIQAIRAGQGFMEDKARRPVPLGRMLEEVDQVRSKFARLIGADTQEVGVQFSTSDGENVVARALGLGAGDNVVVDDLHYETTYLLYQELAARTGLEVRVARSVDGATSPDAIAALTDARTRLVSVAWVSHQNGFRHDLRTLADIAHDRGAYLYTDAIQGVGAISLDVRASDVDFLTAGTYKWLLGGYGVAPFYVRSELLDAIEPDRYGSLHIAETGDDGHHAMYRDGRKYGHATMAFSAVYQLSASLDYLHIVGVNRIEAHTVALAHRLRGGLTDLGYEVWTPQGNRSPIVSFPHGRDPAKVAGALDEAGVEVSLREEGRHIRAGVALFNIEADVDRFLEVMAGLA